MVPEVGIEPTRAQGPLDFESSASTSFTTPAWVQLVTLIALLSQEQSHCQILTIHSHLTKKLLTVNR